MEILELVDYAIMLVIALLWLGLHNKAAHPPSADKRDGANYAAMSGLAAMGGVVLSGETTLPNVPSLDQALANIQRTGGFQDAEAVLAEAKHAYELIVCAFARGNLDEAAQLLAPAVRHVP